MSTRGHEGAPMKQGHDERRGHHEHDEHHEHDGHRGHTEELFGAGELHERLHGRSMSRALTERAGSRRAPAAVAGMITLSVATKVRARGRRQRASAPKAATSAGGRLDRTGRLRRRSRASASEHVRAVIHRAFGHTM